MCCHIATLSHAKLYSYVILQPCVVTLQPSVTIKFYRFSDIDSTLYCDSLTPIKCFFAAIEN